MDAANTHHAPVYDVDTCAPGREPVYVYNQKGEVPARMHWAIAERKGLLEAVATYYAPADDAGYVYDRYIKQIQEMHPGCVLVYL